MMRIGLLLVILFLTGCAGWERATISLPRDEILLTYADARAEIRIASYLIEAGCQAKTIPEATCTAAARARDQLVALDLRLRAALLDRKASLQPADLQGLLSLAGQLSRLAGLPR